MQANKEHGVGDRRDEQLADLIELLSRQQQAGIPPEIDRLASENPILAAELRELWGMAALSNALAAPDKHVTLTQLPLDRPENGGHPRVPPGYEFLEVIGRGGMGIVCKVRQKNLGRVVALKMLMRGERASEADTVRFRGEAEAAARLQHSNIVPVYEVGEFEGQTYFTMQCVEGVTLAQKLEDGPLPPRVAAAYLAPICRAIHEAHQRGILHRDLKPSNILIDNADVPHVSDFGLAKRLPRNDHSTQLNALTDTGAILGTPSYMSPEQAAGSRGKVGVQSDVYGLGAILYAMLTGRPPFQTPSPLDTLLLVLEQEPAPPRLLNRQVDRVLEMICLKCLQKPMDLRYASAGELADDLEAYLNGDAVSVQSGRFLSTITRLLSETPNAALLQNWGLLWMWHSLVLLVLCTVTNWMYLNGITQVEAFLALWGIGLGAWAAIFWILRRRAGPVTFVERQIAHVWAASTIGSISLFGIEYLLRLPVLKLSPVLAVLGGMVFLVKAGMLSGTFYIAAAACFATAVVMTLPGVAPYGIFVFGVVSAVCFFLPGIKYYRQQIRVSAKAADRA